MGWLVAWYQTGRWRAAEWMPSRGFVAECAYGLRFAADCAPCVVIGGTSPSALVESRPGVVVGSPSESQVALRSNSARVAAVQAAAMAGLLGRRSMPRATHSTSACSRITWRKATEKAAQTSSLNCSTRPRAERHATVFDRRGSSVIHSHDCR